MTTPLRLADPDDVCGEDRLLRLAVTALVKEQRRLDDAYCTAVTEFVAASSLGEEQREHSVMLIQLIGEQRESVQKVTGDLVDHYCDVRLWSPRRSEAEGEHRPAVWEAPAASFLDPDGIVASCRDVFTAHGDPSALSTAVLVRALRATTGPAWGTWQRDDLTARGLSNLLAPYGLRPGNVRLPDGSRRKGYRRSAFTEALRPHCPDLSAGPMPATRNPRAAA
ncbi:DUF3631 domain-containing protein [Streptomyces phyllanthi]|uniref:DUF3631 domain-containing protein n=1 Tax=Streptomyces phyllanthi TaxID=1803180 RepID=A0A5N8VTC5_9ACTN|nr:DUF3631 domain-containing protein [Streptomyces phyllanthi]MPY38487.1 DUF3631 domain-containing protein [Streptomyces phyllanthi]